jgi:hypothetical protein
MHKMSYFKVFFLLAFTGLLLVHPIKAKEILTIKVKSNKVPCSGYEGQTECYLFKKDSNETSWDLMYEHLDGYNFKANLIYTLKVKKVLSKERLVDLPPFSYKIIEVLKEEPINPETDIYHHLYKSGAISVKVHPFKNGKRWIELFDLNGEMVTHFEDVRMSYSVSHSLIFDDTGSLKKVKVSENPGAASFWYECEISFSFPNQPLWQVCDRRPQQSIFSEHYKKYYWDIKTKSWKAQEIIAD